MKKVLVTGGCGYLGARISKHLAEKGYSVTAFDRFDPSKYSQWTSLMEEIVIGDIRDETTIYNLAEKPFDVVIHLISLDHHKSEDDPNFVYSINVMPTGNLLDRFKKKGLDKFIYFSTIQCYGKIPNKIINEEHNPSPKNAYGLTHLLSENISNYYNKNTEIHCINIRLSNSYGSPMLKENNCWWLVINDLCKTAFEENKMKLLSDGSPQRDFIHVSDVCKAVELLIKSKGSSTLNNTFHLASGNTLTILELAHIVKKVFKERYHKEIHVFLPDNSVSNDPNKFQNVERFSIDNTKIKDLGFQQKTDLNTGINELFGYLENHKEDE